MTVLDWRIQEATNQTIFREMNEWTSEDDDGPEADAHGWDVYLCECGDGTCTDPIMLTRIEYEAVRSEPTRFAIALNHENPELDSVLVEFERYTVVDKSFGLAARLARASDPRR
ncbi:MAG TPA: hypothetical protein VID47_13860 [Actinomycetota bacterium]|jgi:hypothetical protein